MLIFLEGKIPANSEKLYFDTECKKFGVQSSRCVFIFPGNSSHHNGHSLFSLKGGAGLATVSRVLGEQGYPCLSLPTTSMEQWESSASQKQIVDAAINDLYRAVGAGFDLALPIRFQENNNFFDNYLADTPMLEPNFWNGVQKTPNKPLANYYIAELDKLRKFLQYKTEELDEALESGKIEEKHYQNYLEGKKSKDSPWFQPLHAPVKNLPKNNSIDLVDKSFTIDKKPKAPGPDKNIVPKILKKPLGSIKAQNFPDFFYDFYKCSDNSFDAAVKMLADYTKQNSWLRFFCKITRNHIPEVNLLLKKVETKHCSTLEELLKELKKIKLVNSKGTLSQRIKFIEEEYLGAITNAPKLS